MRGWELLALARSQVGQPVDFRAGRSPSHSIRTLSVLLFAISGLIFLLVEGILVYNLLRFRKLGRRTDSEPPQVYGGQPIEIAWTVAPTLIVCILVLVMARTLWEVDLTASPQAGRPRAFCHGRRPAMVVGVSLRHLQRPSARLHHRQRAARSRAQRRASAACSSTFSRPTCVTASGCRDWPGKPT